jgi:hypothetical protein
LCQEVTAGDSDGLLSGTDSVTDSGGCGTDSGTDSSGDGADPKL